MANEPIVVAYAQVWTGRPPTIPFVAKHKLAPPPWECWIVADALARDFPTPASKQS